MQEIAVVEEIISKRTAQVQTNMFFNAADLFVDVFVRLR